MDPMLRLLAKPAAGRGRPSTPYPASSWKWMLECPLSLFLIHVSDPLCLSPFPSLSTSHHPFLSATLDVGEQVQGESGKGWWGLMISKPVYLVAQKWGVQVKELWCWTLPSHWILENLKLY